MVDLQRFPRRDTCDGFGLVEVMIAGVITVFTLVSIGRFTQAAIIGSSKLADRSRIEARILDNIQEIQQQDSRLTWETIKSLNKEQDACQDAVTYLKNKLETPTSGYYVASPSGITRSIEPGNSNTSITEGIPDVAVITYSFTGPEKSIGEEKRLVELNPTFQADCIEII